MTVDIDDLEYTARYSEKLQKLLRTSTLRPDGMTAIENRTFLDEVTPIPRWPSGFMSDFDALFDGFCGLTVLAGPGGSGKSTHAMACALENALKPNVCVGYFDAENTLGDQIERAKRWWGDEASFRSNMQSIAMRFHWIEVLPGMAWQQITAAFSRRMLLEHEHVLIILDSVFSIARCFGGRPLDDASRIYVALLSLVRQSEGRIRILALSELNKDGGVKGLEGVYASTLSLKFEPEHEHGENVLRLKMLKNRSGRFQSDLGLYVIDSEINRIRRYDDDRRSSYRNGYVQDPDRREH